jgi:hypothetical protein
MPPMHSEHAIHVRGEERFPLPIEAVCVRHPLGKKSFRKQIALGPRFCSQSVEPCRQVLHDSFELE